MLFSEIAFDYPRSIIYKIVAKPFKACVQLPVIFDCSGGLLNMLETLTATDSDRLIVHDR